MSHSRVFGLTLTGGQNRGILLSNDSNFLFRPTENQPPLSTAVSQSTGVAIYYGPFITVHGVPVLQGMVLPRCGCRPSHQPS